MKLFLLLVAFGATACSTIPGPAAPQGVPVNAVMSHNSADLLIDSDPVAARSASFAPVTRVVSKGPWVDRLPEQHDPATKATPKQVKLSVNLNFDAADATPLATRGWR